MTEPLTVAVGDQIPAFTRTTGLHEWNRYAAVNDEFVSIHMDDEAGRAAGFPSAIGMGRLQWSYVHVMLRSWLPPGGRIRHVRTQLRSPNLKGATVNVSATVTAVREGDGIRTIDLDIMCVDQDGSQLAPGSATVEVPLAS
ncbi:MaoC/PaaZ C-terminal domain-containing protein [Jatrophihabitans sp.]|uniref:MaoC family dehydratase n=1 Tax=Jatrophihabitans sp. TaxID=1932789 RepID=UPI0030C697CF|nr:MaoC domain protein dehydratase [Jatrophihabitans sp.]